MKKPITILILFLILFPAIASAEEELAPKGKKERLAQRNEYIPEVFGAVKVKMEVSAYGGDYRFNVRNSRLGVRGMVSPYMKYQIQVDLNNEGKISVTDAYAAFVYQKFELSFGLEHYRFSTDLDRGPDSNFFVNRSFIGKFLTTYYGFDMDKYYPRSIGSKDVGARASYIFGQAVPVRLNIGAFNGTGTTNMEWTNRINFVGKINVGPEIGPGIAFSHYNGYSPSVAYMDGTEIIDKRLRMIMWGGELRYVGKRFRVESEYAQRRLQNKGLQLLQSAHVFGFYQFHLNNDKFIDYIAPLLRWDLGMDVEYLNLVQADIDRFTANRITVGVNFGFIKKFIGSEFRVNFEKYMFNNKPSDYHKNPLLQDKFSIELVASF